VIAKIDLVDGEGALVTPADYKRGSPRDTDEGPEAWAADRVQLCGQALVLREHGYSVEARSRTTTKPASACGSSLTTG
jgi:CRISPR-associated protein Cas1